MQIAKFVQNYHRQECRKRCFWDFWMGIFFAKSAAPNMSFEKVNKPPCGICKSTAYHKITVEGICHGCLDATRREAKRQIRRTAKQISQAVKAETVKINFQFSLILEKAKSLGRVDSFLND
jgi:hypothetical protein